MTQRVPDEAIGLTGTAYEEAMAAARQTAPAEESRVVLPSPKEPLPVARRLVAERHQDDQGRALLARWRGSWWSWEGPRWAELDDRAVRSDAYKFTEDAVYLAAKDLVPWAPNRYKIADLLDALNAVCHVAEQIQPPQWTKPGHPDAARLVACTNGLLDVATGELLEHDPALFNTVAVPFAYDPTAPEPVRWLQFLSELWPDDPESPDALAEFFGYVISGRIDLHKILLLIGPTRAGKGVIARLLTALVGKGNFAGPTLASLGTNFGLQPLIGRPLAVVSDARLGGANVHQVVERLLSISGEDNLTIDRKYREPWTGILPTRFVVISNELPRFGDASGAIAGRFIVLQLRESWLGRENPALTAELLEELPGVLNWALAGLARLREQGRFTEPDSSRDAITALQDLTSPVAAFVRDCCTRGAGDEVECPVLYQAWKAWAEDNGHRPGSAQTFGTHLRAAVPGVIVTRPRDGEERRRYYLGVALATSTHNARSSGPSGPPAGEGSSGPHGPKDRPLSSQELEALLSVPEIVPERANGQLPGEDGADFAQRRAAAIKAKRA